MTNHRRWKSCRVNLIDWIPRNWATQVASARGKIRN